MTAAEATGTLASALLRASWHGGVALVAVWLLCNALPRLPAAGRCWLWRAAIAKLLLSFTVAGTVALPLLPVQVLSGKARKAQSSREVAGETSPAGTASDAATAAPETAAAQPRVRDPIRPLVIDLLVSIWAAGVLAFALRAVRAGRDVKVLRRGAAEATSEWVRETLHNLCRRLGIGRPPQLLQSSQVDTPALVGSVTPAIVLPAAALYRQTEHADSRTSEALHMMLAHELAHVKRRDLWWNWLPLAAQTLLWFHPLAWLASRELRLAQESACDALAIAATGAPPHRYGAMLLDVIEAVRANRRPPSAFSAAVVESRWSVERRLTAMSHLNQYTQAHRFRVAGAVALTVALAVALVPWRLVAQTPQATAGTAPRADAVPAPGDSTRPELPGTSKEGAGGGADQVPLGIQSFRGIVIAPTVSLGVQGAGRVIQVPVNEGDAVKAGQLVAQLDDAAARAALAEAEANYRLKQVQFKRLGELRGKGNTSEAEVEAAEAEAQVAVARLEAARYGLDKTRIHSPCDGVVSEVAAQPGELARDGAVLVKIVDMTKLSLGFELPDQYLPRVKIGQPVTVTVASVPDARFDATITSVAPVVHSGSGTVAVRAKFSDAAGRVRPGMGGEVSFSASGDGAKGGQRAVR